MSKHSIQKHFQVFLKSAVWSADWKSKSVESLPSSIFSRHYFEKYPQAKNIFLGLIFEQHARGTVGRVIHLPWGYGRQGYVGGVILRCVAQKCLDTLSKFGIVLPE